MDAQLRKLADLKIDDSYIILSYKPVNTSYGATYIIRCRKLDNDENFEMYATNKIASYISKNRPTDKFTFIVRKNNKCTYTEIPNAQVLTIKDLVINKTYNVVSYSSVKTKFGDSYMLHCNDSGEEPEFEMYASKIITSYINENKPERFSFKVSQSSKCTYAEIIGYDGFTQLN